MTTRQIIIFNQYLTLCKKIDNLLDKHNILPNIDDHDFCDILYIIRYYYLYIKRYIK